MENATQALLIAAGMLIGIMILSLGVTLFAELSSYVETSHDEIRFNELNSFNTQFLKYQDINEQLTIHDVITVANLANENNSSYNLTDASSRGNQAIFYVAVYLDGNPIEFDIRNDENKLVDYLSNKNDKSFICSDIKISEKTGRVYEVYFIEN